MIFVITCKNSAPTTIPAILPRPPVSDVPPSTQIVMTSNKSSSPRDTLPDCVLDVNPSAPIVVRIQHMANARMDMYFVLSPDNFDASLLPPTA